MNQFGPIYNYYLTLAGEGSCSYVPMHRENKLHVELCYTLRRHNWMYTLSLGQKIKQHSEDNESNKFAYIQKNKIIYAVGVSLKSYAC